MIEHYRRAIAAANRVFNKLLEIGATHESGRESFYAAFMAGVVYQSGNIDTMMENLDEFKMADEAAKKLVSFLTQNFE